MEERRIPTQKPISETITISVAEYHWLTKAATMLEIVMNDNTLYAPALEAVRRTVEEMKNLEGCF